MSTPLLLAPLMHRLNSASHVILAGAGGGYDVVGAVPLLIELERLGCRVSLASLSFSTLEQGEGVVPFGENLFQVSPEAADSEKYCPEAWLSRWLSERTRALHPIWCFKKSGVLPLREAYRALIEHLGADAVVLIDGGIDLILRGDETSIGTPAEDLASLAAVAGLEIPQRMIACLGMSAEWHDGIPHAQVLERIAELTRKGGYLGASGLTLQTAAGRLYGEAVEYLFVQQRKQKRSHVHQVVLQALKGRFGKREPYVWLSPLLTLFWYFDLPAVAESHLFLEHLNSTTSVSELTLYIEGLRKNLDIRAKTHIPI